jgi:TRAP-type transport system periplasmic protein
MPLRASRRGFLGASLALLPAIGLIKTAAAAAQFEFKCGSTNALDHPATIRVTQMWAAIERESGGRIHTHFFPNGQLGGEAGIFTQLRAGAVQFQLIGAGNLASVVPEVNICSVGFAFNSVAEGFRVLDGTFGRTLRTEIAAKGLQALETTYDSGMYDISSSSHPVRIPDDLRGFKIRVPESRIMVDLFKELGASPTPLSPPEVYTALQTKLIDGTCAPLVTIQASRWYEVQKYIGLSNHGMSPNWLLANGAAWQSLPPDLQAIVERNNTKYALLERRDAKLGTEALADKMSRQGVVINPIDQALFRTRLHTYYDTWSKVFGVAAWGALETSLGRKLS